MSDFVRNAPERNLDPPDEIEVCMCCYCDGTGHNGPDTAMCLPCDGKGEMPVEICERESEIQGFLAEVCGWCGRLFKCGIGPVFHGICGSCALKFSSREGAPSG